MHIEEGEIRAYQDGELQEPGRSRLESHLASCTACQQRAARLAARAGLVQVNLAKLDAPAGEGPLPVRAAHARLESQINQYPKEKDNMWKKIISRQYRFAWAALAIVVLMVALLAIPQVRAIANSFLGLFRVQQVAVVQINPDNLPDQLGSSSQFESMLSDSIKFEEPGEPQEVASAEQASASSGIPVRLPEAEDAPQLLVQPGAKAVFNVDLHRLNAILREIGRSDIELPASLDGAEVTLEIPTSVIALFGNCGYEQGMHDPDQAPRRRSDCVSLVQMTSPTITAPPELDIARIGEAFLQLVGMTPEEAASFAQNVDWTTTLVLPIPRYGTEYRDIPVDGVTGTLILQGVEEHVPSYLLIWVKDGILYALTGPGEAADALTLAGSMR